MAFTQYRLTEFGQRTIAKINGFIAVLNTWYNYPDDFLTIEKSDNTQYGEPFDFVKYQAMDEDGLISNVSVITVNVPPDKTLEPLSEDTETDIANDTEYQVVGFMPYNEAVDRIRILEFDSDIGTLTFESSNVFPGFEMLQYDFESLLYNSKKGTGEPYQQIKYQVGNSDGYNATEYTASFNISGLASISEINQEEITEDDIAVLSFDAKINNGRVNGIAKVNVAVTLSGSAWPVDTENFFNLAFDDDDIENNSNFTTDIFVDLNNEGFQNLFGQLNISTEDLPVTGTIKLTLLDINGNAALVDTGNDEITINVSL